MKMLRYLFSDYRYEILIKGSKRCPLRRVVWRGGRRGREVTTVIAWTQRGHQYLQPPQLPHHPMEDIGHPHRQTNYPRLVAGAAGKNIFGKNLFH